MGLKNTPTASLQRGKTTPNECPGYDSKQSDGEVPVMLGPWGLGSTPSLSLLSGPLWPGVVAPDKGPIYGLNRTKRHRNEIEMFLTIEPSLHLNCVLVLN